MESGPIPGFSRASSKETKRMLEVPKRSLVLFDIIYIKESIYQFSDLYLHGKWSNSWGRGDKQNVTDSQNSALFSNVPNMVLIPLLLIASPAAVAF